MAEPRQRLVDLLDYIEQVVRLDERVSFRLSGYRLPDGSTFAVTKADTHNLPSVRHNLRDEEGPVWLEIERLGRKEPPTPPKEIADWMTLSPDPARRPEERAYRLVTVSAAERDAALAKGEVRPADILEAPRKRGEPENAPPKFDLKLLLQDRPAIAADIEQWIAGSWTNWSVEELPRRRTIALYQQLYKVFQLLEVSGAESSIELMWGVGVVHWQKDGIVLHRPLLERRVEIELDDMRGGRIRVRPTSTDSLFDLKPYEELGCSNLASLSDLIRREIQRAGEDEGVSPFLRESYETVLLAASTRLDPDGCYSPDMPEGAGQETVSVSRLTVTDKWVLFARPRSQHVILQDIDRLRRFAEDNRSEISGLAERLVTEPSRIPSVEIWKPLEKKIGGSTDPNSEPAEVEQDVGDVFFPKPFNDDQREIIRRLSGADGFVVQGPPGTGKTHTIANLICHSMATGERVLVVSRGEAALAVLKEQLPKEVQPLAIAVLSNERQGLRQIESAIREIQSVVEGTHPKTRLSAIARLEKEIQGLENELRSIDHELDKIADAHLTKAGPRGETPAALAQRIVSERETYRWFVDRPDRFASETSVADPQIIELSEARKHVGELLEYLEVHLPAPEDLPDPKTIASWHVDLITAAQHGEVANAGPARSIRVTAETTGSAVALAQVLEDLVRVQEAAKKARWIDPLWRSAILGEHNPWCDRLREQIKDATEIDAERAALVRRSVELPPEILDNEEARAAVRRAASGEKLWPLVSFGKGEAKALVAAIKIDGDFTRDNDLQAWRHIASVIANALRQREANARWDTFAKAIGAPSGQRDKAIVFCNSVLRICDAARNQSTTLTSIAGNAFTIEALSNDQNLCVQLAKQIKAAATSVRLSAVERNRNRVLKLLQGTDRTSVQIRQLLGTPLGKRLTTPEKMSAEWENILSRLAELKARARDFETIAVVTNAIAAAGAPVWARRLREEKAVPDDPLLPAGWREVWDHAAADALLARIDERQRLSKLATDRGNAERRCRQLYGELVRERTFYELDRRLSPSIKSALIEFVNALTKIGKGTGKTAWIHRRAAREAMSRCYEAVPCWIMPTWRVAEQLPGELGAIDLVIIDEASQSDVTELPALLRGKKILVVGDDRQVSPTAPFVTQEKIEQLRHHYLSQMPFKGLLEPGDSIYNLMRAVFPNERIMLKEHFRCVEPIIRFSMQFYPEKMLPLRIPAAHERLDPPLVDIYVPHGARAKNRKINEAEADVIVEEITALTARPEMRQKSLGVISLIGPEQAEYIRARLSESIGEELMQRHAILCGDSATFQGTERDIVFLSMVADSVNKKALTVLRNEQRFNVAASRARDRLVLVRSVKREELNPSDLKARLIAHFENPMPDIEEPDDVMGGCESDFERDMMRKLIDRGYRVQAQVGSLGFRIDMVAEGANGSRLAIECDGDRYHGPEQWRQDMRRQRVLERVGWRFWRCFASSFYRDADAVVADLVETLSRMGIEPIAQTDVAHPAHRYTEHRTAKSPQAAMQEPKIDFGGATLELAQESVADYGGKLGIQVGDKVIILFSDDSRRKSVRLTNGANYPEKGLLSIASPLGRALLGAEEGDEIDVQLDDGRRRKALIESVAKVSRDAGVHRDSGSKAIPVLTLDTHLTQGIATRA